jgi:hypothetical protein
MNQRRENSASGFGLVATGSSGGWGFEIDEALDRDNEWLAEIEGPQVYLVFQLRDLQVVSEATRFLECPSPGAGMTMGSWIGSTDVRLVWDNEMPLRCFLVIGAEGKATLRVILLEDDIRLLGEALQQVQDDLASA